MKYEWCYISLVGRCIKIRFRGIKGVISVDPWLTERSNWATEHNIADNMENYNKKNKLYMLFRPSQDKFHAPLSHKIEIVKYSSPTPVCLNRPYIAILDQVSGMQGHKVHTRVCERISALLDRQLMQLAESLMTEDRCRDRLKEFPRRISIDELSLARGFALTQEPFFQSLLRASVAYTVKKQLSKAQIQIPPHLGRTMFGVVDETGILQYGQVFVQYTKSVENKTPGPNAAKVILKGRVLMTKNPSIVAGDARVFDAVDVPELRHLVDVVVFPQYGPRPHPDEMAG
uniref:RNA-dependent RNA polymerase n=1 Tax=Ascaris lumbricoides TaxID=6252 RepID=A0A0M3IV32_ASCLU